MPAPAFRRIPMRSIDETSGAPRAEMSSAMITGIVSSAKNSTPRKRAYVASPITISRQAHAAARSSAHGTWALEKFDGPAAIVATSVRRCSARRWASWWARRSVNRSPDPGLGSCSPDGELASLLTESP
jgi:hypothetical protein